MCVIQVHYSPTLLWPRHNLRPSKLSTSSDGSHVRNGDRPSRRSCMRYTYSMSYLAPRRGFGALGEAGSLSGAAMVTKSEVTRNRFLPVVDGLPVTHRISGISFLAATEGSINEKPASPFIPSDAVISCRCCMMLRSLTLKYIYNSSLMD
jgi:hypothetical protein